MAVDFLHELKVPFFKVGSGDTNNFPYLEKTAKKGLFLAQYFQYKQCLSHLQPHTAAQMDNQASSS